MYSAKVSAIARIVTLAAAGALLFVSLMGTYSPDTALERTKIELYKYRPLSCAFEIPVSVKED